jgi:hypothetical protein
MNYASYVSPDLESVASLPKVTNGERSAVRKSLAVNWLQSPDCA